MGQGIRASVVRNSEAPSAWPIVAVLAQKSPRITGAAANAPNSKTERRTGIVIPAIRKTRVEKAPGIGRGRLWRSDAEQGGRSSSGLLRAVAVHGAGITPDEEPPVTDRTAAPLATGQSTPPPCGTVGVSAGVGWRGRLAVHVSMLNDVLIHGEQARSRQRKRVGGPGSG